jgi:hypothetical protein
LLPKADVIYACDPHFFEAKRADGTPYIEQMRRHGAELWTQDARAAQKHGLFWISGTHEAGLGREKIHFGGNSGYQAVCLAALWGVKTIVLLGFDFAVGPQGESHWFGDHPKNQGFHNPVEFKSWIKNFATLARDLDDAGVDVYNASRNTGLTCFVRTTIDTLKLQ